MAQTATILNGQSQSNTIQLRDGVRFAGFVMPAVWTAAAITILGSVDGVTFLPVHNSAGTEISYTVAANRIVDLTGQRLHTLRYFKLRSGNTATPVNQAADRAIIILEEAFTDLP